MLKDYFLMQCKDILYVPGKSGIKLVCKEYMIILEFNTQRSSNILCIYSNRSYILRRIDCSMVNNDVIIIYH